MLNFFGAVYESVIELKADEIIGSLVIGLVLAMGCAGLCILGQKRSKNPFPLLCGVILVFCALSMAFGVGHVRHKFSSKAIVAAGPGPNPGHFPPPGRARQARGDRPMPRPFGRQLLAEADSDKDGKLTPEEAAQFVRSIDLGDKGGADVSDIDRVTFERFGPGPTPLSSNPPRSTPPARSGDHPEVTQDSREREGD